MKQQETEIRYQEDFAPTAYRLCLAGLDDDGLATYFGVAHNTIQQWKREHRQFDECIHNGRERADAQLAAALHKRAIGFKTMVNGKEKYYPPDVKAMELWLKNRQPNHWRDKQAPLEIKRKKREPTDEEIEAELPGLRRVYEYAQRKKAQENNLPDPYPDNGPLHSLKREPPPAIKDINSSQPGPINAHQNDQRANARSA